MQRRRGRGEEEEEEGDGIRADVDINTSSYTRYTVVLCWPALAGAVQLFIYFLCGDFPSNL